uniref:Sodium/hydrogen exchanger n=1 Tax=Mastacembelus armatus TaxID=205130 RepID=A0A3Q3MHZ2_9TELE
MDFRVRGKILLYIILGVFSFLHGSRGETLPKPPGGITVLPTVPPDHGQWTHPDAEKGVLPLFTMNYQRIQIPFEITLWVLLASFAKIGFSVYHKITIWVPESCLLIGLGLIVGGIIYAVHNEPPAVLTSNVFFIYMLPPIVLESGYFIPTRLFFENIGTVLWFAVVGTLWNSIGIGLSLFAICQIEALGVQNINFQENLLFATIISAVDPVSVLCVFEDVSVNEQLYIVMFGECLFNDAVTVALYNLCSFMANMPVVEPVDVVLGMVNFLLVGLGGLGLGVLFGFVAAFTSRFTSKVREIEPLFIFMFSYLAYLVAELFTVSSIMAIVTCALTMKYYVEENVSQNSCTTIRHVVKMLGSISETLIFFFLGVVTITTDHYWNWGYILFTLLFAFVWRILGVFVLTLIINPFRTIRLHFKDQFGLAYGGVRGAVSFALAYTLPNDIHCKKLFVTATITIILFTVFLQGISIRPLIEFLNVRRTNRKIDTINVEIHCRLMEHTVAGIEDLCGQWGHFYWKDKFMKFNNRILRRILIRDSRAESSIVALYKKLELQNAIEILDTVSGGISVAPSILSLYEEKGTADKSKKKLVGADEKSMRDLLAKNMYKIRQRTVTYTTKHALPNDTHSREILIRRHSTIRRILRSQSFHTSVSRKTLIMTLEVVYPSRHTRFGQPARSSSLAMVPLRQLDTLKDEHSVDVLDEDMGGSGRKRRGTSRTNSSYSDSRVSASHHRFSSSVANSSSANNFRYMQHEAEEENQQQPSSSSPAWAAEPRDNVTRNPLLRQPQWKPLKR